MNRRILAWFSCGDASAAAAKLAIEKYGPACEVVYCDTFAFEHPDNKRFFDDVERWLGQSITIIKSEDYTDIYDVFEKTRWLVGAAGARCTTEMKKIPRKAYQRVDDIHVFGFTADEEHRVERLHAENPEIQTEFPLIEVGLTKSGCHQMVREARIELPAMYLMGYRNNNCIGCVKGGAGYWNKIHRDFPAMFDKMAGMERELGATILSKRGTENGVTYRRRLYLDELPPGMGRYNEEPDIECGVLCTPGGEN